MSMEEMSCQSRNRVREKAIAAWMAGAATGLRSTAPIPWIRRSITTLYDGRKHLPL